MVMEWQGLSDTFGDSVLNNQYLKPPPTGRKTCDDPAYAFSVHNNRRPRNRMARLRLKHLIDRHLACLLAITGSWWYRRLLRWWSCCDGVLDWPPGDPKHGKADSSRLRISCIWRRRCSVTSRRFITSALFRLERAYARHSQMCPQLDVSDKNDNKTQDMSDKARCVLQKIKKNRNICPTDVSDKNENKCKICLTGPDVSTQLQQRSVLKGY